MKSGDKVIVRTESAGVFAGEVLTSDLNAGLVTLANARRLWYWDGAASLSQLSQEGVSKPKSCKFPMAVPTVTLLKVIEILPLTEQAEKSINSVPVWKA